MTQSPSAAHTVQQGDERRSVASTSPPIEAGSRTVRSLMRDQPPSSPAEALRREEHGQQQSAMANVEAAVRALRLFIIEVEQGAAAASRGPHAADSVHLELMPSSFRSLQRLARRLDEAFTLLTQVCCAPPPGAPWIGSTLTFSHTRAVCGRQGLSGRLR